MAETRQFLPGVTVEQAYTAAELVVGFDRKGTSFAYTDNGFTASRPFFALIVSGASLWQFSATPADGGVNAQVAVSFTTTGAVMAPSGGGGVATMPVTQAGAPPPGNATYRLFWERVRYLLALAPEWVECYEVPAKLPDPATVTGRTEPLCVDGSGKVPEPVRR